MASLLAVDLGLHTGLAEFGSDGRLRWYRSRHFGSAGQLRRAVPGVLEDMRDLEWLYLEGGGPLADIWQRAAERRGLAARLLSAEDWRPQMMYPREQRGRPRAKHSATDLARGVIEWSGVRRPTSLRHDAAEAILIGLWGVLEVGWLEALPAEMRRG